MFIAGSLSDPTRRRIGAQHGQPVDIGEEYQPVVTKRGRNPAGKAHRQADRLATFLKTMPGRTCGIVLPHFK